MNIIPVICLGILCLLMTIMYTLFGDKEEWKGPLIRSLSVVCCLVLVLVSANIKAINNVYSLFMISGLAVMILVEAIKNPDQSSDKVRRFVLGLLNSFSLGLIALAGISLGEFNIFALLGGAFLGMAIGFVVCAIKKHKEAGNVVVEILSFIALGLIVAFSIMSLMSPAHKISSIFIIIGGAMLIASRLMISLGKEKKLICFLSKALFMLGLTVISFSVYLY